MVYLNGVEVSRRGLPGGVITFTTPANRTVNDAVYEGPFNISAASLVSGTNLIAAEVHQAVVSGNDVVFGLQLEARVPTSPGAVRLNEVLAANHGSVLNGGYAPDFIELVNVSGVPQALDQFSLSDNPERPGKFIFPSGTILPAQGFLVVWCDEATNAPGLHTRFALDKDGQTVALFAVTPGGYQLVDVVTYGPQVPDQSMGRSARGGAPGPSSWVLCEPTPGGTNLAAALAPSASLRINEWMATSSSGPDWFELYNPEDLPVALAGLFLSDSANNRTNTRIAPLSFIAPRGFRQFIADQDLEQGPRHTNFKLSSGGETIYLSDANLAPIDSITFGPQTADLSQGRLPDGSGNMVSFPGSASPESANYLAIRDLVINELVPDIELFNRTAQAVDISGWWLSDDPVMLLKHRIPDGTSIGPGGYWSVAGAALPFALDRMRGGQIVLSHDGTHRASAKFGPDDAHSYGTVPTSTGQDFVRLSSVTFGSTNAPPEIGPLVISEIQYHPPDLPGDNDDYEFIELANISAAPVGLFDSAHPENHWRLRDAVSFTFATNTTLAVGEMVLVLSFDPATNSAALSNFLAIYDVPPNTRLFGPYAGHLQNSGDSVELVKPGQPIPTPGPDYATVPAILIDRVNYLDAAPWPKAADGTGASLQKRTLNAYGNEPTNWLASGVSPGRTSASNALPTVALLSPTPGASLGFGVPITLSAGASDPDGFVRWVEFFIDGLSAGQVDRLSGEPPGAPFVFTWTNAGAGPHTLTARASDNRLGIVTSAPVVVTVINQPPQVSLLGPTNGTFIQVPLNVVLEASATDADGTIVKVEFFANGIKIGQALHAPYTTTWTNNTSGVYTLTVVATDDGGAVVGSSPVTVTARRIPAIAYVVDPGTVGGQAVSAGLGMDFDVLTNIAVSHLGVFDSGGDGVNGNTVLTVQLFSRNGNSGTVLATTTFTAADPGVLIGGSRFKPLPTASVLNPGSYCIVSYGHDSANPDGNICCQGKAWTTDDGGGLMTFVGASRYGGAPGTLPGTVDTGPVDSYAAGSFEFWTIPDAPGIVVQPMDRLVRAGGSTNVNVSAIGRAPLRYQWSLGGTNLTGATNATLLITNATAAQQGTYQVVVTNLFGAVTSAPANVLLLIEPAITQDPVSQSVVPGHTVMLSVSVTNNASLPVGYRWRRNGLFLPNAYFTLNARTAYFAVTGTNAAPPWTNYAVVVTNLVRPGGILSASAILIYLIDTDNDGLPDDWETSYFHSATNADPAADSDGDGMSNWAEYLAGTDPTDPLSYLKVDRLTVNAGVFLTFGAVSNRVYTIQFSDALASGVWTKLVDVPARGTNRTEIIFDPAATPGGFYRLTVPSVP